MQYHIMPTHITKLGNAIKLMETFVYISKLLSARALQNFLHIVITKRRENIQRNGSSLIKAKKCNKNQ